MKLCFATHNANKLKEIIELLPNDEVVGLNDIGCMQEIPETGATLDENSKIKADFVFNEFGVSCFADDTGLEVEALNGAPGVYSARYAGEQKDNTANMTLLLQNLQSHKNRKARFRTVITLNEAGNTSQFEGIVNGEIVETKSGTEGFGYDPIFKPEGSDVTFAEMSAREKNEISHRGRAVRKLITYLKNR